MLIPEAIVNIMDWSSCGFASKTKPVMLFLPIHFSHAEPPFCLSVFLVAKKGVAIQPKHIIF